MTPRFSLGISLALGVLALAGAARADTPTAAPAPAMSIRPADRETFLAMAFVRAKPILAPEINRTAIDHHFRSDDLVGSVGYLCGLSGSPRGIGGPASSFGRDDTYLGTKLSYAFK